MVKFTGRLFMPLEFGCILQISGKTIKNPVDFTINFYNEKDEYDIPLNLNVLFGKYPQILRSSKINGLFGSEENSPGMLTKEHNPIRPGKSLRKRIAKQFLIVINLQARTLIFTFLSDSIDFTFQSITFISATIFFEHQLKEFLGFKC